MNIVYFDCFSGASGDMILAALLDAGARENEVRAHLGALGLDGWSLDLATVDKQGLRARRATVTVDDDQPGRSLRDVTAVIESAGLPEPIERRAHDTFHVLANAEARVHDVPVEDVHFHETGALDAIVDVVASCAALEHFMPARVVTSPIGTGTGTVTSAHGTLPLPAPAVTEILASRKAQLVGRGHHELITPTGAAVLAAVTDEFGELPPIRLEAAGYGAGERDAEIPNILRVLIGRRLTSGRRSAVLIETNIDDMTPELVADAVESLLAAGAQDAWVTPIVMKKGRPAFILSALVSHQDVDHFLDIIYKETPTLGLRITPVEKDELEREWVEADVSGMPVRVKLGRRHGNVVTMAPEHDDALAVARATGMPLERVYELALESARRGEP